MLFSVALILALYAKTFAYYFSELAFTVLIGFLIIYWQQC